MASKVDMSLDEIIVKNKGSNRRGRGGRVANRTPSRGQSRGNRGLGPNRNFRPASSRGQRGNQGNINGRWSHDMYYSGASASRPVSSGPIKLNIANLDYGVSDSDIKELFSEFGTMKTAAVHYDRSGRSLGTAHVIFDRRSDAMKAISQYNGVHLDGRPMNILIEGEHSTSNLNGSGRLQGGPRNVKRLQMGQRSASGNRGQISRGQQGGRGRGRGGSRRGGQGGKQKIPTAEELDAELDKYKVEANK